MWLGTLVRYKDMSRSNRCKAEVDQFDSHGHCGLTSKTVDSNPVLQAIADERQSHILEQCQRLLSHC
jgi:hypothetical protein